MKSKICLLGITLYVILVVLAVILFIIFPFIQDWVVQYEPVITISNLLFHVVWLFVVLVLFHLNFDNLFFEGEKGHHKKRRGLIMIRTILVFLMIVSVFFIGTALIVNMTATILTDAQQMRFLQIPWLSVLNLLMLLFLFLSFQYYKSKGI